MPVPATFPRPAHRPALQQFAAEKAKLPAPVSMSDIEEYVNNLWDSDEEAYRYATD